MTDSRDISEWTRRIEHWPVPKEMRDGAIKYATSIFERQFPVIFEFNHLSEELEIGRRTLADIVNRTEGFYREFTIPKRRGGYRKIAVPSPSLLLAQRWILRNILEQIALHPRCYGFVKKRSIIDNAREHIGCENLLKVDIRDFFPSIGIQRVMAVFLRVGYAPNVAYYLACICTLRGALPQGAATSPYLSNIIAKKLDSRLSGLSAKCDWVYTRYADDIAISGDDISFSVVRLISSIVEEEGFILNGRKTVLVRGAGKKIVTGLSVSGDSVTIPRAYKRNLKKDIHFIRTRGLIEHCKHNGIRDLFYLDKIKGRIVFWLGVEPQNGFAIRALQFMDEEENRLREVVGG